ncbi:DUF1134 domain-containing protein [Kaistia algarum]|uniref:DUF1134 domain-containing protein n=1 Tax=Kaistia algarum TaxID=2083279 RepID=UPI000CE8F461|nr:EipA family protein [Kaistia algarum]MCX5516270.1 EipA family protein [Kaistia algarum]PPE78807.1 DUF1134 domain-containing protein [Kaistia algarum]
MARPNRLTACLLMLVLALPLAFAGRAEAQSSENYSSDEIVKAGGNFFGEVSGGLASVVEHAVSQYGLPNGYVLGEQGSGALIAGVRYGNGTLYTKNAGQHPVFFQGPSIGWDFGGDGSRVMMLVYNLPSVSAIYDRFVGVNGSAFLVGGVGMTVLSRNNIYVVPIVSGIGARLGFNVGYLKFTDRQTWNPF